jgi:hypothetical protein
MDVNVRYDQAPWRQGSVPAMLKNGQVHRRVRKTTCLTFEQKPLIDDRVGNNDIR